MIQHHIGWPRTDNFKKYVEGNHLINCPITVDDINRDEVIYGKPVPLFQGKMTRITPSPPCKNKLLPLPSCLLEHHMEINLYIDIFYVNGMPFFHTKSGKLNFLSVKYLQSRILTEVISGLNVVIDKYEERGFKITDIHGDPEFDSDILRNSFPEKNFHIYTQGEHVGIVERSIRTIKERGRCICHELPYKRIIRLLTKYVVNNSVKWLNAFPSDDGISSTLSPSNLVEGKNKAD